MLTRKQQELLYFIHERMKETGIPPSFDEMKEALDLASKSGIHRLITALEERGFIRRLPHRARALEVLRLPENLESPMGAAPRPAPASVSTPAAAPQGNVISGKFRGAPAPFAGDDAAAPGEAVSLPLYGRIAAGTPIEALRDHTNTVDVPPFLVGGGEHYALEVDGDSMVDAGIHDGDTVIIKRTDTAENGAIVVALVEGSEVTLKRLRRKGASVALEPANKSYETRIFGPDQVTVQGRLVGLLRQY